MNHVNMEHMSSGGHRADGDEARQSGGDEHMDQVDTRHLVK